MKVALVHQSRKMNRFALIFVPARDLLFLLSTFISFHAGKFIHFSHSLSSAAFAHGVFAAQGVGTGVHARL